MKTKEELEKLKEGYESLKSELRTLNDEELSQVTGGSTEEDAPEEFDCGKWVFRGHITKYAEAYRNQMLYLVSHDGDEYYYGLLIDSFEAERTLWTLRKHDMQCEEHNGVRFIGWIEVSGDDFYLYRERIK